MATPVESIHNWLNLRKVHFKQLQSYIEWAEKEGTYYGQKRYFEKRHAELKEWVDSIIDMFDK